MILTDKWEVLVSNFGELSNDGISMDIDANFGYFAVASIMNYIVLLCGYDGNQYGGNEEDVFLFDTDSLEIYYIGLFAISGYASATAINVNNRIYSFGGRHYDGSSWSNIDSIYYSNELILPTINPTDIPIFITTNEPTAIPVNNTC